MGGKGCGRYYPRQVIQEWVVLYNNKKTVYEIGKLYKAKPPTVKKNLILAGVHVGRQKRIDINTPSCLWGWIEENKNGCWNYTGALNVSGYGLFKLDRVMWMAHRLAYCLTKGDCTGKFVCHTCDTPSCCNPDHLFLGTQKDNLNDMAMKLRAGTKKLTPAQVLEVRAMLSKKHTKVKIAMTFKVTESCIYAIERGITYKWLKTIDDVIKK